MILSADEKPCETCIVQATCKKLFCEELKRYDDLLVTLGIYGICIADPNEPKQTRKKYKRLTKKLKQEYIQWLWRHRKNEI